MNGRPGSENALLNSRSLKRDPAKLW